MPTNQSVTLVKGTVPDGTCFNSVSDLYNTFVDLTTAYVDGAYSLFNYGATEPSPSDRDKPWIKTGSSSEPERMYTFYNGAWSSLHPVPSDSSERRMWVGSVTDLATYDGGNSTEGAMWEVDTALQDRFPIGVGDTATSVKNTGGEKETTLEEKNLPPHSHELNFTNRAYGNGSQHTGEGSFIAGPEIANGMITAGSGQKSEPVTNLPPYYGVYFIKRTSRKYYIA